MGTSKPCTPADPSCEHCGLPLSQHCTLLGYNPPRVYCDMGLAATFRRRSEDMPRYDVAPHPQVPLGLYRHHAGRFYEVIGGTFDAQADRVCVAYRSTHTGYVAHRTVDNFTGNVVLDDGQSVPRFALVCARR